MGPRLAGLWQEDEGCRAPQVRAVSQARGASGADRAARETRSVSPPGKKTRSHVLLERLPLNSDSQSLLYSHLLCDLR